MLSSASRIAAASGATAVRVGYRVPATLASRAVRAPSARVALAPLRHSGRSVAPLTTRTTALVNAVRLRAAPLASASRGALRKFSQGAGEETLQPYAPAARWLHWISGLGMIGCVGLVLKAQDYPAWDKCTPEEGAAKGSLMFYHKSMGLTMLGAAIPRVLIALVSKRPPAPAGPAIIKIGGHVSHLAMYALVIIMPVTGFVMGYMGPKGLPFWFTTLNPGSGEIGKAKNGPMAGQAFGIHKKAGLVLEYMIPLHVGAVGMHYMKGQRVLSRVNPFA